MTVYELVDALEAKYPVKLDLSGNKDGLTLSRIVIPKESQKMGFGSEIMREITKFADNNGLPIALTPEKIANTSKSSLIRFYNSFGFVPNKGRNKNWAFKEAMIRNPKNNDSVMENKTTNLIKNLLRESLSLILGDETPETLTYLIKANSKSIGNVEIATNGENLDEYTIEIVNLDLFEDYDDIKTAKEIITSIWKTFPDTQTILLTPDEGSAMFWEKLGAKPLNKSFWMMQRGH